MPFLRGPRRLAARAVKGAGVRVHWSEAKALDRRSGRSRRSLLEGRAIGLKFNLLSTELHSGGNHCLSIGVRMSRVKPVVKFVLVTCVSGLIGWWLIRALSGTVKMKQLRKLLGDE